MRLVLFLLAAGWRPAVAPATGPCVRAVPRAALEAYVVVSRATSVDTAATATVCFAAAPNAPAIASYHGQLLFDSVAIRALGAEKVSGSGIRVENTDFAGRVEFAGASATGFAPGPALRVVLRVPPRTPVAVRLRMLEAVAVDQKNLLPQLVVLNSDGTRSDTAARAVAPSSCGSAAASSVPVLVSLVPASTTVEALQRGEAIVVQVRGCGFDAARNIVTFDSVSFPDVPSTNDKTTIRFSLPAHMPSRGEVAPMSLGAGSYRVTVKNSRGTSNSLTFTVR